MESSPARARGIAHSTGGRTIDTLASIVADRRALHRIPEIGYDLPKTRAYIQAAMSQLHPDETREVADGMIYVFRAPEGGKDAIAFRADMDALEIAENTGLEFASTHPGQMHACGHDGHMATLLALARAVHARRSSLRRDVVLVFQPAEESQGGARKMIEAGAFENLPVREIYGMHVMPQFPVGRIGIREGAEMAMVGCLDISIEGKSAHGALPHLGCDAVGAMAHFISNVQTLLKRRIDAFEPMIFSIGKVRAGDVRNIVADWAFMECTTRAYSDEVASQIFAVIDDCLKATDLMFGTKSQVLPSTHYPAVVNSPAETQKVIRLAGERYLPVEPMTIAEDFSEYQKVFPGAFFFTGIGDETHRSPLHSDTFNFDERALLPALELFTALIDD